VASIYELIRAQVERAPDAPLDLDAFMRAHLDLVLHGVLEGRGRPAP